MQGSGHFIDSGSVNMLLKNKFCIFLEGHRHCIVGREDRDWLNEYKQDGVLFFSPPPSAE